jgi:hypothetical protein
MPEISDWSPVGTPDRSLSHCLAALHRTPGDYASTIQDFIATQDPASPASQHIASTLDRLAILMAVKSNSAEETGHDLAAALQAFPRLDSLEPQDVWARIGPALELALPPSLLQLDPSCAKKRVKHAHGTW